MNRIKEKYKKYQTAIETLVFGFIVVLSILYFNSYTQQYLLNSQKILTNLEKIRAKELRLNYEILKNNVFLYYDNDKIVKAVNDLENDINFLKKHKFYNLYKKDFEKFLNYNSEIKEKINNIYEIQTINSAIKNSLIFFNSEINYLSNIIFNEIKSGNFDINDYIFFQKANSFVIALFLSRNALDRDLLVNNIDFFKNYQSKNSQINKFKKLFLIHINIVLKEYPKYIKLLKKIIDEKTINEIKNIKFDVFKSEEQKIKDFKYFSYLLMIFIITISLVLAVVLIRREKDKIKLKKALEKLKIIVNLDYMTGLLNRMKFNKDVKTIKNPVLLILNIDRFKNFNDIYGSKNGDLLLKKVAHYIKKIAPENINAKFYRLGSDDFGILYQKDLYDSIKLAKFFKKNIENTVFKIKNINVMISVSIGISDIKPLLENADIALKTTKKDNRKSILKYTPELDIRNKIKENIKKYNILYNALKNEDIFPYFQPIVRIKDKKIIKYEVLARIKNGENVESIYSYLEIAKENKLYNELTLKIFNKTYDYLEKKDVEFSLNLSIEDIMDYDLMKEIFNKYKEDKILKRVTFEILESEAIEDYEYIKSFIDFVKRKNIKIALDDFGSGYSNFAHILNLNIDYIKIDGSLIKNILNDEKSYQIVKLITTFAKENKIKTIAEFVENEDIHNKLFEIGVDYGQGYYYGKPSPQIL